MRSPIPSDECARACEWASLRLDDQLSEFEEVLLEAHLVRCPDCRAFAASISDLTGALRASPLEQPTFAFEAPRQTRGRTFALRAVSAAAAVAVVGVSGLVSLQVSTTRARPGTPVIGPKVMSLKERQMNHLTDMTATRTAIRRGLAAAEQVIVGDRPVSVASSTVREIPAQ
jgi:Putative zinc-finger